MDPDWDGHTEAVSEGNDFVRSMLIDVLRAQVEDDELFEKMVPHFPPFAKRALRDDGRWAAALARPHVDLVTTPIERDHATRRPDRRWRGTPCRRADLRDRVHARLISWRRCGSSGVTVSS